MEPENKKNIPNIQTYTNDMVKVIEDGGGGLIKKMIREQETAEEEKKNMSPESKKNKVFMILGITLIFFALLTMVFLFFKLQAPIPGTANIQVQFAPIIFTEKTTVAEVGGLAKEAIGQTVQSQINGAELKKGGVQGIYLTENKKVMGFHRFLTSIKAGLSEKGAALINDNFLLGAVHRDAKNSFILLQAQSFADVFGEMRSWEKKMFFDLYGFFDFELSPGTSPLLTKDFEDGIVENKNARILYDEIGQVALMYIFADEHSIVIARDTEAAREVMLRLSTSQIKK